MDSDIPAIFAHWSDKKVMHTHYQAVCEIRRIFEKTEMDLRNKPHDVMTCWDHANPYYNTSDRGIVLEVIRKSGEVVYTPELFTPFGQVKIMNGGIGPVLDKTSRYFFQELGNICDMIEIRSNVSFFNLSLFEEQKLYHLRPYARETGNGVTSSLYQLKFHNNFAFAPIVNENVKFLFEGVNSDEEFLMEKQKRKFLREFSGGKEGFVI